MTIQQLSKEIGIGIDTLRIWERRYGFPIPGRDARGHRSYSSLQVKELRIVKKLQSLGHRPGKIFALSSAERRNLLNESNEQELPHNEALQQLTMHMSPNEIDWELRGQLQKLGLDNFIHQYAVPLLQVLDHRWTDGSVSIAREHLISDRLEQLLREQISDGPAAREQKQILFLTLSGERHKLGLLLAAALFHAQGLDCLLLNEELPLSELPPLAAELQVAGVALSFSAHYPARQAKQDLAEARKNLHPEITLIAGGQAVQIGVRIPKLVICSALTQIPEICRRYFAD
jgi:DNA-binding transcriptional MerR regulator